MSDPDALRSVFEDHLDLEMNNLTKPNPSSSWNSQFNRFNHSRLLATSSAHHGTSHDPQPTPMVHTVVSKLSAPASNNIAIASIIPTDPLFPPRLWPQRPYHVGEDITEVGRGTHFIRVEDQNDIYYWITCHMDNTGVEFSMWVGRDLVIDPNPQDMLSQLAQVGSFDVAVVGTSFWTCLMVLKDAILVTGKEDARCEGETSGGKDKEEWEVRDEGYGASRLVVQHHRSTHQVSPLWWFYGHF